MYKERIGHLDEFHKFLQDNEFIVKGYRLNFNSYSKIIRSMFLIHNETVNIWTHFIGAIMFLGMLIYFIFTTDYSSNSLYYREYISTIHEEYQFTKKAISDSLDFMLQELSQSGLVQIYEESCNTTVSLVLGLLNKYEDLYDVPVQEVKRWPILVFLLSALACLMCSTLFHLFNAHSHKTKVVMNNLDYAGIAILICGSFFPPIYYLFFCQEELIYLYLIAISVCSGIVFAVTFSSNFQEPHCRWFRGVIFLLLGLLGVVPIGHISMMPQAYEFTDALWFYILMGVFYVLGVLIYIFRFPERYLSGKLDYIGNSHNIWHCMIVFAAIFHYIAAIKSYEQRKILKCSS